LKDTLLSKPTMIGPTLFASEEWNRGNKGGEKAGK
jgi:hypothetical protein